MESNQGPFGSNQGKHDKKKKPSPKSAYNKKNYKSSPNLSPTVEKSSPSKVKSDPKSSGATNSHNLKKSAPPHSVELATASGEKKLQNDPNSTVFLKHQKYQPGSFQHQNPNLSSRPRNPNQPNLFRSPNQPTDFRYRNPNQSNPFRHPNQPSDFKHRNPSLSVFRHRNPNQSNEFMQRNPGEPIFRHRSPSLSNNFRFPNPRHTNQNQQQNLISSQSNNPSFIQRQPQDRFSRPLGNLSEKTHFQNRYGCLGLEQVKHHNKTSAEVTNHPHKTLFQLTPSTNQLKLQNSANFKTFMGNSIITIKCKKKKNDFKTVNTNQKGKKNRNFKREERKKKGKQSSQQMVNDTVSSNVVPLFSFQKMSTEPENNFDLIEFSDDDFEIVSQDSECNSGTENLKLVDFSDVDNNNAPKHPANISAVQNVDLIDLSFDSTYMPVVGDSAIQSISSSDDSDSSSDSEESAISSELSVNSSTVDTESSFKIIKQNMGTKEAFVSVFWDIENCNLPSKKSVIDFVSYIRQTFYEGRSEDEFTAACDTSKLSNITVKELEEASVILIHVSSISKNAADKKLQSCLQKFQYRHRNSNSAIVLISSDSDFTQVLHDMRYQHHVFINLICSSGTKRSLIAEANKYVLLDDIVKKLPDRCADDNMQYLLLATNLPQMKPKSIKKCLSEKLKSFNCRVKIVNNASSAEIAFQDRSVCNKAMNSLKGYYLGGNAIDFIYEERVSDDMERQLKDKSKSLTTQSFNMHSSKETVTPNLPSNTNVNKELDSVKHATLCVFVSKCIGNTEFWENSLSKILKNHKFSLQWDDSNFHGCLLIHFNSLKKAQQAKRVLQKNQLTDENAPKFMKMIKHNDDMSLKIKVNSIEESNMKKINDHIQIIQKRTSKCLKNHQTVMDKIKLQVKTEVHGSSEAVSEKLIECSEQMDTFKDFSEKTIEYIKNLSYNSENLEEKLNELLSDFTHECNSIFSALPIYAKKKLILQKCIEHQVIIIRAETGSGKSTQLTQYIWKEKNLFGNGQIICTQPRKIAAVSLAKHVSSQVGCKLGNAVGFQVGMSEKKSLSTRILYVTDFTMLKMLVSGGLENVSFIIIDEAHERTIYTDILLGMIKRYLPLYSHLKIIITSATIDTSIFRDYFNLTDDAVLHIGGRTFPVEDIWLDWDVIPTWDYFTKTIDTAIDVLSEELGDILCFLVTPLETEKAAETFSERLKGKGDEKKIKVYTLHGKLDPQEQQKVFDKTPSGFRKVIFATNCAETSITIPGIKYVIDCGMVKESQYDAARNMNVLSVRFVSRSSSEQRRGRAGRTQIGKCYHLYSKNNYNHMADNTDPEILRINLGQALLKLMKMGIRDPAQFDFVQSPPRVLLNSTMKQLLCLKAVDENNLLLTDLGNKMSILPLEPRLSHLIFQGFDKNIECEAITVAALLTVSSSIFFRNTENKDEADKKKRRFCESENDFLTYLEVYKEWVGLPNRLKSQWCVTNCINARSMRIVQETINEIVLTLQKELSYKVTLKFKAEPYDTLIKAIFYSFSQNLSVFSGHNKFGYKSLNVPDRLLIHPSSSVSTFGSSSPQFVVYETILKTTQNFLMNVCPVTKDIIFDGISTYGIEIDLKALEDLIAIEFCISPLGEKMIINNFIGKKGIRRKELLKDVKELTNSDLVEVDIDIAKGAVKIYGYGNQFDQVPSIVSPIVNAAQEKLLNEEIDIYLFENTCPFIAILEAGGCFKDVILPGEFRDVKVILNSEADISSVIEKLQSYGPIKEIREWKKYYKVTFEIAADAKKALESSQDQNEFVLQSIHKCRSNIKNCLYKVDVCFLRRMCTGIAFVTFDKPVPPSFSLSANYKGSLCNVAVSRKTNDLRITNLPADTDRKDLEPLVSSFLPEFKIKKCIIVRKKPYDSLKEEMDSIKNNLFQLFSEFTFKENIEVYLKNPSTPKDWTWNATVYFKNCFDGETAVNVLKSRKTISNFLGGIVLKPIMQTYLYSKPEIFSVVKDDIQEALQFFQKDLAADCSLDIAAVPVGSDKIEIKITSNSVSVITDARRSIYTILIGDEIKFLNDSDKEKLFTDSGKEFIKKLSRDFKDCFISQNVFTKTITVFGKINICNITKMEINAFLKALEKEEFKDISLRTDSGKSILKELFKLFRFDLTRLKEEYKISDFKIDKYRQILTIKGDPSAVHECEAMIQDLRTQHEGNFNETAEMCPVCFDEVADEKHRLEYCGHAYCKECLLHLFQSSENIPLNCDHSSENTHCEAPIVVADILWALKERESLKKVVYEKCLLSFVERRSDICYCPTPDCPMIFRATEEIMTIFKCPACNNDICTRCKEVYHSGLTCSLYQCLKSNSADVVAIWMQAEPDNRKRCPSCLSPIEKNGGCNHMTCWKCKCHMCWICLQVFPNGRMVYDHQPYCPQMIN